MKLDDMIIVLLDYILSQNIEYINICRIRNELAHSYPGVQHKHWYGSVAYYMLKKEQSK